MLPELTLEMGVKAVVDRGVTGAPVNVGIPFGFKVSKSVTEYPCSVRPST